MYKFRETSGIEDFLLNSLGIDLVIPSFSKEEIVFFHNGDKMTVNTETGELVWEPVYPGEMFTSKLSMRIHQWFSKGIIVSVS